MNIHVINFETCKDHYLITRMLKTTAHNQIEYTPSHYYQKKAADCYFLITKMEENALLTWCHAKHLEPEKTIVLSNHPLKHWITWTAINLFDHDVDFEKICQWLMTIREKSPEFPLFVNRQIKAGKIRKDHDYEACAHAVLRQNPSMKKGSDIFLFVKEKTFFSLHAPAKPSLFFRQYYLKGIAETYDYLIVSKEKKEEIA